MGRISAYLRPPVRLLASGRDRRIGGLIAVLWLLSLADLGFTLWAHSYTALHEMNPIARRLLEENLVVALVAFKVGTTLCGAWTFWRLRRFVTAELGLWLVVLVYVALAVHWSDYTSSAALSSYPPPGDAVVRAEFSG